jgi:hypothetical protein
MTSDQTTPGIRVSVFRWTHRQSGDDLFGGEGKPSEFSEIILAKTGDALPAGDAELLGEVELPDDAEVGHAWVCLESAITYEGADLRIGPVRDGHPSTYYFLASHLIECACDPEGRRLGFKLISDDRQQAETSQAAS